MHESSLREMRAFADGLSRTRSLVIGDIGSMDVNGSYRPLFDRPPWTYIGYDVEKGANVDVVLPDLYRWNNVPSDAHDVVVSGQVLEHVARMWDWIREVHRIVKPGGFVCIIAPHTYGYHPYPVDCWRIWPDGMRALLEHGGFQVISVRANELSDTVGIGKK